MSDWHPIATAPTDGTWVLLTGGSFEYGWEGDSEPPMVVGQFTHKLNGQQLSEGRWQAAWYDGGFLGEYEEPTHWRPLLDLPEA